MTRRGVALLELLLAIALLLLLGGIVAPRLAAIADAAAVRAARRELLAALDAARGAPIRLGTSVALRDDGTRRTVAPLAPPDTQAVWRGPVAARHGVHQTGPGHPLTFGPAGIATGASNRSITLSRGSASMTVVISRLGRIR